MPKPRILIYDVENSPVTVMGWPPLYDFSVVDVVEEWYMLSFAYKWHGEGEIKFERKAQRRGDDRALMRKLWKLYDEADAVLAHNGDRFDQKKAWSRMLYHRFGPTSPYVEIDTLKLLKQKFNLTSNKLDYVAKFLGVGEKLPNQGIHTWKGCMRNDPDAWKVMERYNKHDVMLLDGVYGAIAPYVRTKLNMQQWTGTYTCTKPTCGSTNVVQRGYHRTAAQVYKTYRCRDCGGYSRALLADDGRLR